MWLCRTCLLCRKILNELESPVAKIEDESNSSQSQDGEDSAANMSQHGLQYQQGTCMYMTNTYSSY